MGALITPGQEKQLRRMLVDAVENGVTEAIESIPLDHYMAQTFLEQGDMLTKALLSDLLKHAKLLAMTSKHRVDLNVDPIVPEGYTVKVHRKGGIFYYDKERVAIYYAPVQAIGRSVGGAVFLEAFAGKEPFNACLFDYLLLHPELPRPIGLNLVFLGTVFLDKWRKEHVRFLRVDQYAYVHYGMLPFDFNFLHDCPALIKKASPH
ncbi:MAG: hypothetical protein AAB515_02305 [Patescibacteria group bacterium]